MKKKTTLLMWPLIDLAGIGDLATKYKRGSATIANWRIRYEDFPAPLTHISGAPVFSYQQVAKWHNGKNWKKGKHDAA